MVVTTTMPPLEPISTYFRGLGTFESVPCMLRLLHSVGPIGKACKILDNSSFSHGNWGVIITQ